MVLAEDGRQIFFEDLFFTLVDEAGRLVCLEAVSLSLAILMAIDGVGAMVEEVFGLEGSSLLPEVLLIDFTASTTGGICVIKKKIICIYQSKFNSLLLDLIAA